MSTAVDPVDALAEAEAPWRRLSVRVIWVDLAQSVLALLPGAIAVFIVGVEPSWSALWPLALIAAFGVLGAIADITRWAFTRYRVTATDIERRTGVLVRRHRTLRRDRIRAVDSHAKLRHRLAGLRIVTIGAGQQGGASEAALVLDALSTADAARLRQLLLHAREHGMGEGLAAEPDAVRGSAAGQALDTAPSASPEPEAEVFATLRPWWVVYNMVSVWAYLMAAGLLWGVFWLASTSGVDLLGLVSGAADWDSLGWLGTIVVTLVIGGAIGALGMGVNFLTSNWRFELARIRADGTTCLRTRRGLFSTREVNRDESRMRGLSIDEPLLWRWMGMADTNVITTGLGLWDMEQPTAILPRGPVRVAREVAARVYRGDCPMDVPLAAHPAAALRHRLVWATLIVAVPVAVLVAPAASGIVPSWLPWAALMLWPVAVLGAVISYRALGHAVLGDHLVVRSGLMTRSTSALRRDAVSTIAVRQSVLQRRLGLCTVSAMTAAGWGAYEAHDVAAREGVAFAAQAAPGLLDEFLVTRDEAR